MKIDGHVAAITGGGSGLGAATARAFRDAGARVIILDFDGDRAQAVAKDLDGAAVAVDVSDPAAVEAVFDEIDSHFGTAPRIVVNCAGIGLAGRIVGKEGKTSIPLFEKVIRVNLMGTYYVMTHAVRRMMELNPLDDNERGVVINTASAAYQDGQIGQSAYSASKGGVASMCLPAARELARAGIRVNAIAPGLFNTPMMESLPPETVAGIVANIPYPARLGHPAEFGLLATQIAGNSYLNGEVIRLDGATRLPPR